MTKTQYVPFRGKAYWSKVYVPDEFMGASRWTMNIVLDDDGWKKFKELGIQKKIKEAEYGKYFPATRSTTKLMNGKLVYFTPPVIYDKSGAVLVGYFDENDKMVRSYEDPNKKIIQRGENVSIGNGSEVEITLSVYPTMKGPGNRLESIKIIDLIEYKPAEDAPLPPPVAKVEW